MDTIAMPRITHKPIRNANIFQQVCMLFEIWRNLLVTVNIYSRYSTSRPKILGQIFYKLLHGRSALPVAYFQESWPKVKKLNSMVWVRERTIPTELPPLVGEVIANFCG
jgi:hypothetical protein